MDLPSKVIGILLAVVIALLANEGRRVLRVVKQVATDQRASDDYMKRFTRSIFTLLSRLHPTQAEIIADEIQNFYWKPGGKRNGRAEELT